MTVGRLALLFLLIPLTAKADRTNNCSEKTKLLIMKCAKPGGDPAKGYVFSAIEGGVEVCDNAVVLGWFLIDPITSTRWKIEISEQTRTAETKSGHISGYFKGPLYGPFHDNNRNIIKTKGSFWSENAEIVLENHNFTISNSFVRQTAEITVNSDTLWNLARSTFTIDSGNGELQEVPIGEPLPKMLKKRQSDCKFHMDTTTVPENEHSTTPAIESTSTPSTTAAVKSQDGPNLTLVISLGVACAILLIVVIVVVIILICMKKSKKKEPKKEEPLKNWTYDRNSQEKETWQQRLRRELKQGKRSRASVTGSKGAPLSSSADSTQMNSITPSTSNEMPPSSTAEGSSKKMETVETSVSMKMTENSSKKEDNSLGSYYEATSAPDRDSLGSYKE